MRSTARASSVFVISVACLAAANAIAAEDASAQREVGTVVYTADNASKAKGRNSLPLLQSVSQFGITWSFSEPARVGQFVNGDWYVVGPTTVKTIAPAPVGGRNGSTLNIPITQGKSESKLGFDDRIPHGRYDATLFQRPPFLMTPGDVLFSSISLDAIESIQPMLPRSRSHRTKEHSPIRTVAVLTCLAEPVPADAFRPGYSDPKRTIRLARNLRRDRLPRLASPGNVPSMAETERLFERPWTDIVMDEFGAPVDNMPVYGQEFTRAVAIATLLLALDRPPQEKETLLLRFVQVGIDLWGLLEAGRSGWPALGGHGNGRKWAILFAGLMLDDAGMQRPNETFSNAIFSEDLQTMFDDCWTGAKVVYAGHVGPDGLPGKVGWGRYEHLPPSEWQSSVGEDYRRCCTSKCWIGEALAIQLYGAEQQWNHDAFLVYADRWMAEDDSEHIRIIEQAHRGRHDNDWARQGMVWDPFVKSMWDMYRSHIKAPADRWKYASGEGTSTAVKP